MTTMRWVVVMLVVIGITVMAGTVARVAVQDASKTQVVSDDGQPGTAALLSPSAAQPAMSTAQPQEVDQPETASAEPMPPLRAPTTFDLLERRGEAQVGPAPGMPFLQRWQAVTVADDLADELARLQRGDALHFAPFADRSFLCRIRSLRQQGDALLIAAVPEQEPQSLLTLELRADALLIRLDRLGKRYRYALGRHADGGLATVEIDHAAAMAGLHEQAEQPVADHHGHDAPPQAAGLPADEPAAVVGGAAFELADLPEGRFKEQVLALSAQARHDVVLALRANPRPRVDFGSLQVDQRGQIFYHCEAPPLEAVDTVGGEPVAAPLISIAASSVVPAYHSRSSQTTQVLHLDFDGETLGGNMAWGSTYDGKVAKAFSIDSDRSTFSDEELFSIMAVWEIVAESFAPFEIDVTTEAVSSGSRYTGHCIITEWTTTSGTSLPHSGAGGVAYVGVYGTSSFDPASSYSTNICWVYPYTGTILIYTAAAAAHEFGHNIGLSHDGHNSDAYYTGHSTDAGNWIPIMGGGAIARITHWSEGEYNGATNTEDDLNKIANDLGYITDDHGDDDPNASYLSSTGTALSESGIISNETDTDVFAIACGAGSFSVTATPALDSTSAIYGYDYESPHLDVQLLLYNESGGLVTSANVTTTMAASISTTLGSGGTYYLHVVGAGQGSPTSSSPTGYTTYGSIGSYDLSITRVEYTAPEIAVTGTTASEQVLNGDSSPSDEEDTDFGLTGVSSALSRTFTIANIGNADLTVGTVSASGSYFSITSQPSGTVSAGGSTTVTVQYLPTVAGSHTGTVSFSTNDSDEGSFSFSVAGSTSTAVTWTGSAYDETSDNDGSIDSADTVVATLSGDSFTGSDGDDFVAAGKLSVSNLPGGLTAVATRDSSSQLTITLTGQASEHDSQDTISNLSFTFADGAFDGGNASSHTNNVSGGIAVNFIGMHVTSADDSGADATIDSDFATDRSDGGGLSLREALNYVATNDEVTFADDISTILLNGELGIITDLSIDGDDRVTLDGQNASRIIHVSDSGATVTFTGLSFQNGSETGTADSTDVTGGLVRSIGSSSFTRCHFTDGYVSASGKYSDAKGGAIYQGSGTLVLEECTFTGNEAYGMDYPTDPNQWRGHAYGGAVYIWSGTLTVSKCLFDSNTALNDSTWGQGAGGGLAGNSSDITLELCTFYGNIGETAGGAVYQGQTGRELNIYNCTITGNQTNRDNSSSGGAVQVNGTPAINAVSSIIVGNTRYVSDRTSGTGGFDIAFASTSGIYELTTCLYDSTNVSTGLSPTVTSCQDVAGADPLLTELADNGGSVKTVAFEAGCLAVDAGSNPQSYSVDSRGTGYERVVNGTIDIGSFENQAPVITSDDPILEVVMSEDGSPTAWVVPAYASADPDTATIATASTWSVSVAPSNGSAAFSDSSDPSSLVYTPDGDYNGSDSFTIQLSDGHLSTTRAVAVNITAVNDAPVIAQGATATVAMSEDSSPTGFSLTLSATDAENDTLTWSISSAASNGSASLSDSADPATLAYVPTANWNGSDSFTVSVADGSTSSSIVVTVNVAAVNDAPTFTSAPSSADLSESASTGDTVASFVASDSDGSIAGFSITAGNDSGLFAIDSSGALTVADATQLDYETTPSYALTIAISDNDGALATTALAVTILDVDEAPTAVGQSQTIDEDTALALVLSGSDPEGAGLTYTITEPPSSGTLSGSAPNLTYTPDSNVNGSDSFSFTVNDGSQDSAAATVSLTITPVDDAPTVLSLDSTSIAEHEAIGSLVGTLSCDDPDGDPLTYSLTGSGADDAAFSISGDQLLSAERFSFATKSSYAIQLAVSDGINPAVTLDATISISDAVYTFDVSTITLDATVSGGGSYTVTLDGSTVASDTAAVSIDITHSGDGDASHTITAEDNANGRSDTVTIEISEADSPAASDG